MRIISWNILAQGLLQFFWRSSYGLPVITRQTMRKVYKRRIDLIIEHINNYECDILCLQETEDKKERLFDNKTVCEYIADRCDMKIVSESFKKSRMKYDYPPHEQRKTLKADTGVAILCSKGILRKIKVENLAIAEDFGESKHFRSGVGSPFNLIKISNKGNNKFLKQPYNICNVHIRMNYPHIKNALSELEERISNKANIEDILFCGDFNMDEKESLRDMRRSKIGRLTKQMINKDEFTDNVFIGKHIFTGKECINLTSGIPNIKTTKNNEVVSKKWRDDVSNYVPNEENTKIFRQQQLTSDHIAIVIDL